MIPALLFALQMSCPEHAGHTAGMPFSQEATKHTFRLFADGGAIEVRALDEKDASTLSMVRQHLQMIAKQFAEGNFDSPMAVHDRLPDGAAEMKQLRSSIDYSYGEVASGGRVRIRTTDPKALEAVHQFLRFQIREHKTGDPTEVSRE